MKKRKTKNNDIDFISDETIVGILMVMPIYMVILMVLKAFGLNEGGNEVLFITLMYAPILIGIILSLVSKNIKSSNPYTSGILIFLIIIFLGIGSYNFYYSYFVDTPGWDGFGYFLYWIGSTIVVKILSLIYYKNITGWKKALKLFGIYVIIVLCSLFLGFWA